MDVPQQETWYREHGVRWLHRPAPGSGRVVAGVVLGRGHGDQPVHRLGVADVAAEVLRRELGRPLESPAGVLEASVEVQVDLRRTVVLLVGSAESVRRRLQLLEQLLACPAVPEPPEVPASRRRSAWSGWSTELGHWFGVGAASLSAEVDGAAPQANPQTRDPAAVTEALRSLDPRAGTPVVALTTDPGLVGCAFDTEGAQPVEGSWLLRDRGGESLVPGFANNLLTFAAPLSVGGAVAEQVLLGTLHSAVAMATGSERLLVTTEVVGGRRLLAVRAQSEDTYDAHAAHRAVAEAVLACREPSAEVVRRHLAAALDPEARQHPPGLVALASRNLWTPAPQPAAALLAATRTLQPEEVHRALDSSVDALVLGLPPGTSPVEGFPLRPRTAPPAGGDHGVLAGRSRHRPLVRLPTGDGTVGYTRVVRDGAALTVTTTRTDRARTPLRSASLDLSRLAAAIELDSACTMLVDEEDRRVRVVWPAISGRERLARTVRAVTPPGRHLTLAGQSAVERVVAAQLRVRRRVLVGLAVFLPLLVAFVVTMELTVERAQPDTVVQVEEGTTATLGNGTTMTLTQARLDRLEGVPGDVLLAEVEVCGGGPTRDDEAGGDARNYVSPSRFDLGGTDRSPVASWPRGTTPLGEITLPQGRCTTGSLGWLVPPAVPADLTVTYANRFGDQLTWTVRP